VQQRKILLRQKAVCSTEHRAAFNSWITVWILVSCNKENHNPLLSILLSLSHYIINPIILCSIKVYCYNKTTWFDKIYFSTNCVDFYECWPAFTVLNLGIFCPHLRQGHGRLDTRGTYIPCNKILKTGAYFYLLKNTCSIPKSQVWELILLCQ
jgi:hypothetical protein